MLVGWGRENMSADYCVESLSELPRARWVTLRQVSDDRL
jgi:hypothetical protein